MSSILKVDNLQTGAGATHSISSLGVTSPGTVLQEIYGFCDGRTVSGITFGDVDSVQGLTTSYADITGSTVAYTPPTGTKTVVYTFSFNFHTDALSGISHYKLFIDGTEVTLARRTLASAYDSNHQATLKMYFDYPILIDSSLAADNIANAKLKSWTSAKTIKMQGREYASSYQASLHKNGWWDGGGASGTNNVSIPTLSIKAIA